MKRAVPAVRGAMLVALTAALVSGGWWMAAPLLLDPRRVGTVPAPAALAGLSADLLVLALAWLACAVTCAVRDVAWSATVPDGGRVASRSPLMAPSGSRPYPRALASLVAALCGVGLAGALGSAASAGPVSPGADPDAVAVAHLLDGLRLPDRAADPRPHRAPAFPAPAHRNLLRSGPEAGSSPRLDEGRGPRAPRRWNGPVVVRAGDTLWAIAAAHLPPNVTEERVNRAWRELYAANRSAIGDDPDRIRPGTTLTVPATLYADQEEKSIP